MNGRNYTNNLVDIVACNYNPRSYLRGDGVVTIFQWIEQQLVTAGNEARRLFHGRGGCFPGYESIAIDWFSPLVIVRLYDEIDDNIKESLINFFRQQAGVKALLIQTRGRGRDTEHEIVFGEVPECLIATELGLQYEISPAQFQNNGLFLDMRHGREWVMTHAKDRNVLNLFAFTCAFSVAAIAGGAKQVVNVDMSKRALSIGRANHRLNNQSHSDVKYLPYDMLKSWSRIRKPGPYDLIIIDPPSFQPGSFIAEKDYRKVLRRLHELASGEALVLACHNDPTMDESFVRSIMQEECSEFTYQYSLSPQEDFPNKQAYQGVKGMIYQRGS